MHVWIKGLIAALITGAATSATVALAAPDVELTHIWPAIVTAAMAGAAAYLKQSPIPKD